MAAKLLFQAAWRCWWPWFPDWRREKFAETVMVGKSVSGSDAEPASSV